METKPKPLTDMQNRFCSEYVTDLNATKAAIRAGYSEKSAREIASRLLQKEEVKEEIRRVQKEAFERSGFLAERVIRELAALAFAKATDFVSVEESEEKSGEETKTVRRFVIKTPADLSSEEQGAISEIKQTSTGFSVKMHNKVAALKELNKLLTALNGGGWTGPSGATMLLEDGTEVEI